MVAYLNNGRADIYDLGLDAQAFAARPRALEVVDPATGVLTLTGNGLFTGSLLRFVVEGAAVPGRSSAVLPDGLSASLMYTAAPVSGSSDLFRVAPVDGSTITSFGDAGAGVFSIVIDPGPVLDRIAENESRNIDEALTAQAPPIEPDPITGLFPDILVGVCSRRTAVRGVLRLGLGNPIYQESFDALVKGQRDDDDRLKTWLDGRGLKVEPLDQTTFPDDPMRARNRYGASAHGNCHGPTPWMRRSL